MSAAKDASKPRSDARGKAEGLLADAIRVVEEAQAASQYWTARERIDDIASALYRLRAQTAAEACANEYCLHAPDCPLHDPRTEAQVADDLEAQAPGNFM